MARNTIGQFISALRKSNGMTQKQLAEQLNVSDKAVSRWERDECSPDLSLIPVIADIFGVASDEILRGERNIQYSDVMNISSAKSEKQIKRLIDTARTNFTVRSLISVGIGFIGLIAAMICNFGFLRAYIGFFVGSIFYLAAIICEVIFTKLAFFSVENDDFDDENINLCKMHFFRASALSCSVIIFLFAITLPLVLIDDAYAGIVFSSWIKYCFWFGIAAVLICAVLFIVSERIAIKNNVYIIKSEVLKLSKRCLLVLSIILVATLAAQISFNLFLPKKVFSGCAVYTNVDEFVEYIETPVDRQSGYDSHEPTMPMYFDETGTEIIEDEINEYEIIASDTPEKEETEYLYTEDGETVLCSYVQRNMDISLIEVEWENSEPKILVYTSEDIIQGSVQRRKMNIAFISLYFIETAIVGIVYYRKRKTV